MFNKKYFQDRPILFMNLVVVLGAIINVISILLRIDTSQSVATTRYIAALDIEGYIAGGVTELYSFAIFAVVVSVVAGLLSARLYVQNRALSLLMLSLTTVVLLFNLLVSSAILNFQ
jgi:hypothetical protein